MIGTVTFDGALPGPAVEDLASPSTTSSPASGSRSRKAPRIVSTSAYCSGWRSSLFFPARSIAARALGRQRHQRRRLRRAFIHSLCRSRWLRRRHYLTFLLFEGQAIRYLASDPFGQGWDLFGTASAAIDYSLLSQNGAWYAQVGFVVVGHVAALILAHDRALVLYDDSSVAVRSQYWMLAVWSASPRSRCGCSPRRVPSSPGRPRPLPSETVPIRSRRDGRVGQPQLRLGALVAERSAGSPRIVSSSTVTRSISSCRSASGDSMRCCTCAWCSRASTSPAPGLGAHLGQPRLDRLGRVVGERS